MHLIHHAHHVRYQNIFQKLTPKILGSVLVPLLITFVLYARYRVKKAAVNNANANTKHKELQVKVWLMHRWRSK